MIRRAAISRIVFGIPAGQAGGMTSRYSLLADNGLTGRPPAPRKLPGMLAAECREMLRPRR